MAVVGAHGDGDVAGALEGDDFADDGVHVDVAGKMVGFVEVAGLVALGAPEMDEVDRVAETADHAGEVVVGADAVGTGAETKTVGG